ncbi:MAG: tetratricopeptide repeat protein [Rhodobacteraceae bacterium]|nr:tetratricopeptide repeat protein [Paracoccaceae bacterium]
MKTLTTSILACLLPFAVFAGDREDCANDDLFHYEKIAACNRVLDASQNDPDAYVALGEALSEDEQFAEAIEAFSKALAIAPDHIRALERRSVAFNQSERHQEAETDLVHLTEITGDEDWHFYRLGYTRGQLGNHEGAIAALDQAIALDSDYYWSHYERGRALSLLDRDAEAGNSYAEAAHIKPLSDAIHSRAYRSFQWAELPQRAAYHARILYTLDPNKLTMRDWLQDFVGTDAPSQMEPLAWVPPDEGQEIRYFNIFAPVDSRDDTTKSIEDLINFFGGNTYPMPETASVFRRSYVAGGGDDLDPITTFEHRNNGTPSRRPPQARFRGLFQLNVQPFGPGTPVIAPVWGDTEPAQVWPLQDGASAQGIATFTAMCATGPGMSAIMMGCRPDIQTVPLGQIDWSINVETDRIHVPMGVFDTYKVSFVLRGDITILGKTNSFDFDASYWISPELNNWVAAIFTIGDKYSYSQAMEVVE